MRYLSRRRWIEHRFDRIYIRKHAIFQRKSLRGIHEGIYRCNEERRGECPEHDGNQQEQMQPWPSESLPRI
ncbi:hypothetical protein D3C77_662780 [compost metagenome]